MNTKNLLKKVFSIAGLSAVLAVPFLSLTSPVLATTQTSPSLQLTDVVDKQLADRGETLSYTLTLTNNGNVDLTTVYLKIDTPNLANYVAGSSNYTRSANGINHTLTDTWITDGVNFGTVPAGTNVVLKYQTTVASNANNDDILWSNAAAKSDQTGQVNANAWTRVLLKNPGLCAEKTADKLYVQKGDTVTFTIQVCNNGNVVLHDILIGDIIHDPLQYVPGSTTFTRDNTVTPISDGWLKDSVNIGDLNPGAVGYLKYQVTVGTVTDGQTIQNVAQLKSVETPNILQCAVLLHGKVLGIVTPPTELPNTGPGDALLLISGIAPVGFLIRRLKSKI